MDEGTPEKAEKKEPKARVHALIGAIVIIGGFALLAKYGNDRVYWFDRALVGVLTEGKVDQIARAFVTSHDVEVVDPNGQKTVYTPADHARLDADVRALLGTIRGRDAIRRSWNVEDASAHAEAEYGDRRLVLELVPTGENAHGITQLRLEQR